MCLSELLTRLGAVGVVLIHVLELYGGVLLRCRHLEVACAVLYSCRIANNVRHWEVAILFRKSNLDLARLFQLSFKANTRRFLGQEDDILTKGSRVRRVLHFAHSATDVAGVILPDHDLGKLDNFVYLGPIFYLKQSVWVVFGSVAVLTVSTQVEILADRALVPNTHYLLLAQDARCIVYPVSVLVNDFLHPVLH
jgi:hypothetical protein